MAKIKLLNFENIKQMFTLNLETPYYLNVHYVRFPL